MYQQKSGPEFVMKRQQLLKAAGVPSQQDFYS